MGGKDGIGGNVGVALTPLSLSLSQKGVTGILERYAPPAEMARHCKLVVFSSV